MTAISPIVLDSTSRVAVFSLSFSSAGTEEPEEPKNRDVGSKTTYGVPTICHAPNNKGLGFIA